MASDAIQSAVIDEACEQVLGRCMKQERMGYSGRPRECRHHRLGQLPDLRDRVMAVDGDFELLPDFSEALTDPGIGGRLAVMADRRHQCCFRIVEPPREDIQHEGCFDRSRLRQHSKEFGNVALADIGLSYPLGLESRETLAGVGEARQPRRDDRDAPR